MTGNRVMNGTFTEVWIDGVAVAGLSGFVAKSEYQKSDVAMCGQMAIDSKKTGMKSKISITCHKIYTFDPDDVEQLANGIDKRHTVIGKLADPDAYGAERVAFYNVSFDDYTFFDATANKNGSSSLSGTFTEFEFLDKVLQA